MSRAVSAKEKEQRAEQWLGLRQKFLLTQIKMAELSGISRRTVQLVESAGLKGAPRFSTLRRFLDLKKRLTKTNGKAA